MMSVRASAHYALTHFVTDPCYNILARDTDPHYESPPNPTFSDFSPFGGWTKPSIKQFGDGDVPPGDLCGISVDNNVAPSIVR